MRTGVRSRWGKAVLVCAKCSKKLDGGFGDSGKPLAKALRRHLKLKNGPKARAGVVEVKCLDVCPKGAVLVLEIDRAQTKNSLKLTEMDALGEMFASERVLAARCLVIRGAGTSFCSGRDVREIDPEGEDAEDILRNRIGPILQRLYRLPVPTISRPARRAACAAASSAASRA